MATSRGRLAGLLRGESRQHTDLSSQIGDHLPGQPAKDTGPPDQWSDGELWALLEFQI